MENQGTSKLTLIAQAYSNAWLSTPERGRSRKVEKKKKDRRSATSRSTSAGSRSGQTYERGRRASRSVPRTQVETSKRKSIHAASQSHSPGRSTSPSVKDYKEDNAEIFKANLPRRLSYNAKRLDALVALSKQENARNSSYVTARRKRLAARKQYFQSLPAEIKDQVDKAAKTIDSLLSARWQRRRLGRRFRLILASEAPSRVQLALCHASSLKSILEKDLMFRGLLKRPIYYTNLVSKRSQTLNSDVPMPSQVQALVRDMFVQLSDGIKLARRNCLWSLLVQGIEQLYSTYNAFASVGLIDLELWSDKLWLVFYLAADDLIDFLQIATIEKSRSSQVSHTGHDLKYHTRPKLSQTLPFESWNDMYTSQYQAIWKDVDGRIQHKMVPFDLVTQFFTLSMQIMSVGKHPNRLRMLYARLRGIYPVSLDSLVSQIPEISTVVQGSSDTSTVSTISEQSESILEQESMIRAAVQEGRIDEGLLRLKNLSDLLRSNGDHKNSAVIWKRALNLIFNHSEMMYHWQDVLGVDIQRDLSTEVMKGARKAANLSENAKYLLFAGLIVTEISQSFYLHNLDMQQELVLFATVCLTGSMLYGLPEPQNLLGFRVNVPAYLSSTLLILSGQFSIDPSQMMCSLIQLQKGLIQLSAPSLAFPIVSLTNCLASTMSVVPFLKGVALLSEVNVLIKSGLHKDVLKALLDIKTGQALTGIERQCFTKSDLKLHRLGNDALANHLEVLEVGMNENAYSPVFLRLLSLTGAGYVMSLLTAGNLGQEQVEALTENLIQQLKESYMEKTKERPEPHEEPNSTWVFLSICEAMTMFQLAQLCLYQSKFGLATKWYHFYAFHLSLIDT